MAAAGIEEGFMTSVAPASFARGEDLHYKSDEEFVVAAAEAMREEYRAIVDAGLVLQIDDPSLPDNWDMIDPDITLFVHHVRDRGGETCRIGRNIRSSTGSRLIQREQLCGP